MILTQSVYIFNTKSRTEEKKNTYIPVSWSSFSISISKLWYLRPCERQLEMPEVYLVSVCVPESPSFLILSPTHHFAWVFSNSFLPSFLVSVLFHPCASSPTILLAGGCGLPSERLPIGTAKASRWLNQSLEQQSPRQSVLLFILRCSVAKMCTTPCLLWVLLKMIWWVYSEQWFCPHTFKVYLSISR